MPEYFYRITMDTPLGPRYGKAGLQVVQGKTDGFLELFNRKEPLTGRVDESGSCRLQGKLVTLFHTIRYTAVGLIEKERLCLKLQGLLRGEPAIFQITGVPEGRKEKAE